MNGWVICMGNTSCVVVIDPLRSLSTFFGEKCARNAYVRPAKAHGMRNELELIRN
jgi:hypothetical protein